VVFSETVMEPSPIGPSRQVTVFNDPALRTSAKAIVAWTGVGSTGIELLVAPAQ
jgi:hypothetical protein